MSKQLAFLDLLYGMKKQRTQRELFMTGVVVLWSQTLWLIEPYYPKAGAVGRWPAMSLEATIFNFRHCLERPGLTEAIFAEVSNNYLAENDSILLSGVLMDATSINATSLAEIKTDARDPEMSIWSDKGYISAEREATFNSWGKFWVLTRKALRSGKLHSVKEETNLIFAMFCAKVEHSLRLLKCQFGYVTTRYWGLTKNWTRLSTLIVLGNPFLGRQKLIA